MIVYHIVSHIGHFMEFELLGYNYGVAQDLKPFSVCTDLILFPVTLYSPDLLIL